MKEVFIVYKTDTHHSYNSREIIGVATSEYNAITICKERATQEGDPLSAIDIDHLQWMKQTQDYKGPGEFQFESMTLNILL